jgi:hypothetical protein
MMNLPSSMIATVVSACGGIIFSQAISFGWPSKINPELSSHIQAACVVLAGLALVFLGNFVRQTLSKLSALERELAQLKAGTAGQPGGSSL